MPTLEEQAKELKRLSTDFNDFKKVCQKRTLQDTYRFAEIAEADDWKYNLNQSDRVMVNGKIKYLLPYNHYFNRCLRKRILFRIEIFNISYRTT